MRIAAFTFMLFILSYGTQVKAQTLEELKTILVESKAEQNHLKTWEVYRVMGYRYLDRLAYDSAKMNYEVMMAHTKENFSDSTQTRLMAKVYQELGTLHNRQGLYEQSLAYVDSSVSFFRKVGLEGDAAKALINKAVVYVNQAKPSLAIEIYDEVLRLADVLTDTTQIKTIKESSYINIGKIYIDQQDWRRSVDYTKKALDFAIDDIGRGITHLNLCNAYMQLKAYDTALFHGQMADTLFAPVNNPLYEYNVGINLAEVYNKLGDYDKELALVDEVEKISAQYDEVPGLYFATNARGRTLTQLGRLDEGLKNLKRAEAYARQLDNQTFLRATLQNLAEAYSKKGRYKLAYEYHEAFYELDSALLLAEKTKALDEMLVRYESEKKDRELSEQRITLLEQDATLDQKTFQNRIMLVVAVAVALLSVLFYNLFRSRKKAEFQAALIQEQERGLEAVFEATEKERKRIAKDLHDGVGQQLSALKRGFEELESGLQGNDKSRANGLKTLVDRTANDTREISHRMMPRSLTEFGLVPAIDDMLAKTLAFTSIEYSFEHFNLRVRYDDRKEIALYRILQELINNVIKHSEAKAVSIQLFENQNQLLLIVEDNGKGLEEEKSNGLGMMNIKSRLNTLEGKAVFEPSPDAGTVATISIPAV